jgi:hypothetical protein
MDGHKRGRIPCLHRIVDVGPAISTLEEPCRWSRESALWLKTEAIDQPIARSDRRAKVRWCVSAAMFLWGLCPVSRHRLGFANVQFPGLAANGLIGTSTVLGHLQGCPGATVTFGAVRRIPELGPSLMPHAQVESHS